MRHSVTPTNTRQIKQASEEAVVERRRFQGHGDHMDFFQNNFFLNGFVVKEVRTEAYPMALTKSRL